MGLRLGTVDLPVPIVLAPMAGITDLAFRRLVHGSDALLVSEMVTARGLVEDDRRTWSYVDLPRDLGTRSLQLYGSDPAVLGAAVARVVAEDLVDHIDLNLGCPVPKITSDGGGAALPVKRPLLRAVLRAAVQAAGSVPITIKMRLGLDDARLTHLDAGRIAVEEGVAAVALHARTVEQGYSGLARWDRVAELRAALPDDVPVLGNGDVWTAADAVRMMEQTGCNGVVVGRGCLGRPWLFADLARAVRGEATLGPPLFGETAAWVRRHLDLLELHAEADATAELTARRFRKHLRWYLEGYEQVPPALHASAGQVGSRADVEEIVAAVPEDAAVLPEAIGRPRGKTSPGRVKLPYGWWDDRDAEVVVADPTGVLSGG
ncbi:MAG: nifR3 family TIM-barrel protein [Nitriliruptoraceae bacterium]